MQFNQFGLVLRIDLTRSISSLWQADRLDLAGESVLEHYHHGPLRATQESA